MVFESDFLVVYLRVVQSCNLNCTHCFTNGNKDPFMLADLKNIEMFLKGIRSNINPKKVVFYIHGGETFLAPLKYLAEVNQLIRTIFDSSVNHIIPQTNLLITVDDKFTDFIKKEYDGEMGISWDYKIRFRESNPALSEKRFFKNLKTVLNAKINVAISITVQRHLLDFEPLQMVKRFDGVKSIDFELLTIFDEKTKDLKVSNVKWAKYLKQIVDFYIAHDTTWSLPQIDLFTKSIMENKLYRCKCDCCNSRTFTMNPNGTVGLCPDKTYYNAFSTAREVSNNWGEFEKKAVSVIAEREASKVNPVCLECEHYDICGGNCEESLFVEGENECPLSKSVIGYQIENIDKFGLKLEKALKNLPELN